MISKNEVDGKCQTLSGFDRRAGFRNCRCTRDSKNHLAPKWPLKDVLRSESAPHSPPLRKVPRSPVASTPMDTPVRAQDDRSSVKSGGGIIASRISQPPWRWLASFSALARKAWRPWTLAPLPIWCVSEGREFAGNSRVSPFPESARFKFGEVRLSEVRCAACIPAGIARCNGEFAAFGLEADAPALLRRGASEAL